MTCEDEDDDGDGVKQIEPLDESREVDAERVGSEEGSEIRGLGPAKPCNPHDSLQ